MIILVVDSVRVVSWWPSATCYATLDTAWPHWAAVATISTRNLELMWNVWPGHQHRSPPCRRVYSVHLNHTGAYTNPVLHATSYWHLTWSLVSPTKSRLKVWSRCEWEPESFIWQRAGGEFVTLFKYGSGPGPALYSSHTVHDIEKFLSVDGR